MLLVTNKTIEKLKHDLVREGLVDFDKLSFAEDNARNNATNLAQELVNEGFLTEVQLLNFIENKLHIPFVELDDYTPDKTCLSFITQQQAMQYNILPLFKIEDVLTIAMSDPLDLFTINMLFENASFSIEPVVCSETSIISAIEKYYLSNDDVKDLTWQDKLISDNLNDDILKETILDIIFDAIKLNYENIFLERSSGGINLFFSRELKGFIPNILVPRFLYVLRLISGLDNDVTDITQKNKFQVSYNAEKYSVLISIFPTKFGERISLSINRPLKNIFEYNWSKESIDRIFEKPVFAGLDLSSNSVSFVYSLAEYLSEKKSVLIVENNVVYDLSGVKQIEFSKNVAVHFDDLIDNIEFQKFDVVFFEKIYTKAQLDKLKLLASEVSIVTSVPEKILCEFDCIISENGRVI